MAVAESDQLDWKKDCCGLQRDETATMLQLQMCPSNQPAPKHAAGIILL
jgi:hypothetical protein